MVGFTVIPLLMVFYYGLTDRSGTFTFANVMSIMAEDHMKALLLSLAYSIVSTIICLLIASPLAMILPPSIRIAPFSNTLSGYTSFPFTIAFITIPLAICGL